MAADSPPPLSAAAELVAPRGRDVTLPPRESPSAVGGGGGLLIKSEAAQEDGAGNSNFKVHEGPHVANSEAASSSDNKLVIDEGGEEENHASNDLMKSESTGERGEPQSNKLESPFGAMFPSEQEEEKAKGGEGGGEDEKGIRK